MIAVKIVSETTRNQNDNTHQIEHAGPHDGPLDAVFLRLWYLVPENLRDTFMPEDVELRKIPGEETQLVVRMAWYRDLVGHILFHYFYASILLTLGLTFIVGFAAYTYQFDYFYALIPLGLFLTLFVLGLLERLEYTQWRLLKTNSRLVISIPQHGAWPLVDNIELKGTPTIIDTNWSPNPMWRVFQFFTGARDLYISMSGLQFVEGKAKVRDALIIPDIMPDDVFELKKLVFKPK